MNGLIENIDYYINEDGFVVITKKYHFKKDIAVATVAFTAVPV